MLHVLHFLGAVYAGTWVRGDKGIRAELADACGGCAPWSVLARPHELRTKQTRPGVSTSTCSPCTHSNQSKGYIYNTCLPR